MSKTSRLSQNTVHIIFLAESVCLNLFAFRDALCRHCIDGCLFCGVTWEIQVSSLVTTCLRNSSPSLCYRTKKFSAVPMRFVLWSSVSIFGTHLAHSLWHCKCSVTISCSKEREMCTQLRHGESSLFSNLLIHLVKQIGSDYGRAATLIIIVDTEMTVSSYTPWETHDTCDPRCWEKRQFWVWQTLSCR
jgi:hypothetical protein